MEVFQRILKSLLADSLHELDGGAGILDAEATAGEGLLVDPVWRSVKPPVNSISSPSTVIER